jgi:hypothetical protein
MLSYVNIANSRLKHKSTDLGRVTKTWSLAPPAARGPSVVDPPAAGSEDQAPVTDTPIKPVQL